jgi:parallel beta-helix repeat protein
MMTHTRSTLAFALVSILSGCGADDPCKGAAKCIGVPSGASTKEVEDAFALVSENGTIAFGEGRFEMEKTLNLATAHVTVRGQGIDQTTLDFGTQTAGEDGLLVTGDGFTIEDLRVLDAKGNGIKVTGTVNRLLKGVTFRRVAGEWTKAASAQNGKYAIYPVLSEDVLMEDCVAKGSSDAGIYVGQSKNIIVRRNKAAGNVAGLEIENSIGADVYDNECEGNSAGILVFGLPDLIQNTSKVRVFHNTARANNVENFAGGGIIEKVPAGVGVLIMSASEVEVFDNLIESNDSLGLAVVSYCIADSPYCDDPQMGQKLLDPFPRTIYVHDNSLTSNGGNSVAHLTTQSGSISELAFVINNTYGASVPALLYDGVFAPPRGVDPATWMPASATNPMQLCLKNNGGASFSNFDAASYDASSLKFPNATLPQNTDPAPFDCTLSLGLGPIQIAGVTPSPK